MTDQMADGQSPEDTAISPALLVAAPHEVSLIQL
jgi:hypothetical protein